MSVAEDVLTGLQCSHCGVCFEEESGFPVLCSNCFSEQGFKELHSPLPLKAQIEARKLLIPKSKFKEL